MQATFIHNPFTEKPNFIKNMAYVSKIWNECLDAIKRLKKPISNSSISLWDICIETNLNKLAYMFQNEEICENVRNVNFIETYSYFKAKFQLNFKNSMPRAQKLRSALSIVSFWNTPLRDNNDCWSKILEYLNDKSLRQVTRAYR